MNYYLITIAIYLLGIALLAIRYKANKKDIKVQKSKEGKFYTYIRFMVLGLIPIINVFIGIAWLWWSLLTTREDFVKRMSD